MANLDLKKNINELPDLPDDQIFTVIFFCPDNIDNINMGDLKIKLEAAYDETIKFIGLSHLESRGFVTEEINAIVADHKIPVEDLSEVESICKFHKVLPISFYMRNGDIKNNSSCFLGMVKPIPTDKE